MFSNRLNHNIFWWHPFRKIEDLKVGKTLLNNFNGTVVTKDTFAYGGEERLKLIGDWYLCSQATLRAVEQELALTDDFSPLGVEVIYDYEGNFPRTEFATMFIPQKRGDISYTKTICEIGLLPNYLQDPLDTKERGYYINI